ncbi:MAG: EAL domain-containing protein, partial [Gammaproteobacteria bacterium]|nr:EAL domain-containing protein [Gammaproteobacteria bacterium]
LKVVGRKVAKIFQTHYDELTGIYNRRAFESIVEKALISANERNISHCLLNINLDQLKVINDAVGRDAGDWIIERTAVILKGELSESASIGYLGGGKYGILLERCNLDNGAHAAEELRSSIQRSELKWNGKHIDVTVTVGVALVEPNTENIDYALEATEIALDSARQNGRNRVRVFSHDDQYITARKSQMYWANYVQTALREDHFRIHAQTIQPVSSTTERFHFEILIGLVDVNGVMVFPDKFIPPAEKFNLMPLVDRWVINATFESLADNGFAQTRNEGIVSINLSGQSVANDELAHYIAEKLEQYDIDPSCVCFEITETAAIGDLSSALRVLNQIKQHGCHLSLDDFGTGLSSFSYLRTLPVDYVKIDGSFVKVLLEDEVSHAMVTSINHVGHVMGLKTVAEFVENDLILAELEKIGVDYVQGYAIARPVPITECLRAIEPRASTSAGQRAS